ncbi:hypothetical protein PF001_g32167 [Phytophthora fragariae]|uniref:Uncharacterized protein n=1 Tax=Phytophthora fragariae TaxID=53985 RepID=A0A6A4AQD2_9STRA|nr:hypothetical protein PF001_g32167 [Phytophthora fragariae]
MLPTPQPLLASGVPAEVAFAVSNYQPKAGFELVAQGPTERSFIYKCGGGYVFDT